MRPCFVFAASAAEGQPETLSLLDEIGFWGTQAKDFSNSLKAVKSKILNVEISSPGGDVFAGLAMYNMLRNSGKEIHVKVVGIAASAASVVAMAGDKRIMPKNTMMMVHNPWTIAAGNADEFRETADTLDKIGASLLGVYVARAGIDEAKMKDMLASDTYLSADEALELGLATEVTDEVKVEAKFDLARADLPENVRAALGLAPKAKEDEPGDQEGDKGDPAPEEPVAKQIETMAKAAGFDDTIVAFFALSHGTVEKAKEQIAQAREVQSICAIAKKPEQAAAFIKAGKSVAEARAELVNILAKEDEANPVNTAKPSNKAAGVAQPTALSPTSLWAAHDAHSSKK